MFNLQRLGTAAAVLVSAVTPVHAASSSSASIGPLTFQLFDLAPMDGIAPLISFIGIPSESAVQASASQSYPNTWQNGGGTGLTPWQPISTAAAAGAAWSTASIAGNGTANGTTLSAFGSAADFTAPDAWASANYSATAKVPTSFWSSFTLSANTLLLISGQAWVTAAATPPTSFFGNQASATVTLQLSGTGPGGQGSQSSSDGLGVSAFGWGWPQSQSASGSLAASFVNATNGNLNGSMTLSATVSGNTYATLPTTPIPEPTTWAMLLAGLGAVGFVARRRRS
jgi:hypothetical protein